MGEVVLVSGGARSGKSLFAENLAAALGPPVTYVATAEAYDAEMDSRIARHKERRPPSWITVEAPLDLQGLISRNPTVKVVLVDCLAIWASNRLLALGDPDHARWQAGVDELIHTLTTEVNALIAEAREAHWHLVLVTSEVGFGVVPPTRLGRAFRDLLGEMNQRVATQADAVFLVVAGLGIDLKRQAVSPTDWAISVTASARRTD